MKIKSIKVIKGKNKWSESKDKLIHMVLDLGEYEQKPSNKIEGFYERIKEYLPSLKSHRCSEGKPGGFFKRIKEGTWMGHIIEHVALELQTLAGYDTGWGRTRGVKGEKGVYNVVFNYEDEDKGKLAAKEAINVVKDIINDNNPQIDKIVKKLKSKSLKESIRRIIREEIEIPGYLRRRLHIADDYFDLLDPSIICDEWTSDEGSRYVNSVMSSVVDEILKEIPINGWEKYIDYYDKIYEDLVRMGYKDKVHDFFYDTLLECE